MTSSPTPDPGTVTSVRRSPLNGPPATDLSHSAPGRSLYRCGRPGREQRSRSRHEVPRDHPSTSYHGVRRAVEPTPQRADSGSCRALEPCPNDCTNGLDTLTMGSVMPKVPVSRSAPPPLPLMDWTPFAPAPHPHIVILVRLGCGSEFLVSVGAGAAGQEQSLKQTDTRF